MCLILLIRFILMGKLALFLVCVVSADAIASDIREYNATVELNSVSFEITLADPNESMNALLLSITNVRTESAKKIYRIYIQVSHVGKGQFKPKILARRHLEVSSSDVGWEALSSNIEIPGERLKDGIVLIDVLYRSQLKHALIMEITDGGRRFTRLNEYLRPYDFARSQVSDEQPVDTDDSAEQRKTITAVESRAGVLISTDNTLSENEIGPDGSATTSGAVHYKALEKTEERQTAPNLSIGDKVDVHENNQNLESDTKPDTTIKSNDVTFCPTDSSTTSAEILSIIIDTNTAQLCVRAEKDHTRGSTLDFKVLTINVPGTLTGTSVVRSVVAFHKERSVEKTLRLPKHGLQPGTYKLMATWDTGEESSAKFTVTASNLAVFLKRDNVPEGPNIALAALGGEVVSISAENTSRTWKPGFLIDGFTQGYNYSGGQYSSGWRALHTSTAEIVIAFNNQQATTIDTIGVSPVEITWGNTDYNRASPIPRDVEIWVSDTLDDASFQKVAQARIVRAWIPQLVRFNPVQARFIKFKVVNTHGANNVSLGELMVFEAADASPSILDTKEVNLANPAVAGFVVSASSAAVDNRAWQLTDGRSNTRSGWISASAGKRSASYTPQDIVLGFGNNDTVLIERIELDPLAGWTYGAGDHSKNQVKNVVVSISSDLDSEWEDIGEIELPKDNARHSIKVDRMASRVRVRVLSNHGGKASMLGEIRVIEGKNPDYRSLTRGAPTWIDPQREEKGHVPVSPGKDSVASVAINRILHRGQLQSGRLAEVGQVDRYQINVDTVSTAALTFTLTGKPDVRTTLKLLDDRDEIVKFYTPASDSGKAASITWLVAPGNYTVEVAETPINQVIVYDTSGSMKDRIKDLEQAIRSYITSARADEYINLVRFGGKVEPLLDSFSNDKEQIELAIKGQFVADGYTPLIDALYKSTELVKAQSGRQVILVFTDGQDTSSKTSVEALHDMMKPLPLELYSIGLGYSLTYYNRRTASNGHQFLDSIGKPSTGGRYFAIQDSSEMANVFELIGADLRAPAEYTITANYTDVMGGLQITTTGEMIPGLSPPRFQLILDASGSMKRVSGKQSRMAVAKSVLKSVLQNVPDSTEIALRTFGHRIREGHPGDCEDSELLVPFITGDKKRLNRAIDGVIALGTTPIAYSVEQAISDVSGFKDMDTVVILVTDGEEECRDDLLQVVQAARSSVLNFSMNIVGFDLDKKTTLDLSNVAAAADGGFVAAGDAEQLNAALIKVLSAPYTILDGSGVVVAQGVINGKPLELIAGVYTIAIDATGVTMRIPGVHISADQVRSIHLNRQGDSVDVRPGIQGAMPYPGSMK